MALFAGNKGIDAGDELTYDYNFKYALPVADRIALPDFTQIYTQLVERHSQ